MRTNRIVKWAALALAACGMGLAGGCSTGSRPGASFESPDAAVTALVEAARAENQSEMKRILGSEADQVLSSGDEVDDRQTRQQFIASFDEKHALQANPDGSMTLEVGATQWPMPIPLVKDDKGAWRFDTEAGLDEMLSRRIGRNELDAMQVCLAIVDAQREYARMDADGNGMLSYAQKFVSDPGKRNGLYWPSDEGQPPSPLGPLAAQASAEGYMTGSTNRPRPFHGYYYRILTSQGPSASGGARDYMVKGRLFGGFGVVAWPAEYGNSGLKTFIVNHEGVVYEKDLGEETDRAARAMKSFDPGEGWKKAE